MTRFGRWLRDRVERWLGRYYEGPHVPVRLLRTPLDFSSLHPNATPEEWQEFAMQAIAGAYEAGYVRGFEASERVFEKPWSRVSPEDVADLEAPGWRDSPPVA